MGQYLLLLSVVLADVLADVGGYFFLLARVGGYLLLLAWSLWNDRADCEACFMHGITVIFSGTPRGFRAPQGSELLTSLAAMAAITFGSARAENMERIWPAMAASTCGGSQRLSSLAAVAAITVPRAMVQRQTLWSACACGLNGVRG